MVQHADGLRLHLHEQQGRSSSGPEPRRVRPPGEEDQGAFQPKSEPHVYLSMFVVFLLVIFRSFWCVSVNENIFSRTLLIFVVSI